MYAPPLLVRVLADHDPALSSLPSAQRAAVLAAAEPQPVATTANVVGAPDGVPVRAAPHAEAPIVAVLRSGARVALGELDNGYHAIRTGDAQGYASAFTLAPAAVAAPAADLPPGRYVVTAKTSLELRDGPSTSATVVGLLAPAASFVADGGNENFFAHGHTDTDPPLEGWVTAFYLAPEQSEPVQTRGDMVQLRALLASWAAATPGAPAYGSPADLADDQAAADRQSLELAAFQKSEGLQVTGAADQATRDALISWARNRAVGLASRTPAPTTAPSSTTAPALPAKKAGIPPWAIVAGIATLAFFVLEERRTARREARAAEAGK